MQVLNKASQLKVGQRLIDKYKNKRYVLEVSKTTVRLSHKNAYGYGHTWTIKGLLKKNNFII